MPGPRSPNALSPQCPPVTFCVLRRPPKRLPDPLWKILCDSDDPPAPLFQHKAGFAFRSGVVVDLNDLYSALVWN